MKTDVTVRPATSTTSNDSFDLVYASLSPDQCRSLIPALASRSQGIFVGQRTQNLQNTRGDITNESLIAEQCGGSSSTSVTFRFRADKNTFAATTMDSCLCAPETETQTVACPANSAGSITQRRTGVCTGGTPACPSLQWSSWVTASNTCGANATPVTPTTPVAPVAPQTCVPSVETQTVACPSGQVGGVLQQRSRTCPANTWGAWSNVSSSCQPDPNRPACTPSTQRQTAACPAGQGGQIVQERASTCDVNGNQIWSNDWKNISSTCTASCVAAGTCCTVSRQTSTEQRYCGAGNYGSQTASLQRTSTCASATSAPAWPSSWNTTSVNGTCTACPTPTQDQETQSVSASAACPAGQNGSHTWTSNQVRTRTRSYDCSSDRTTTLPAPTVGAWSAWSEQSRAAESNTCSSGPYTTPYTGGYGMWVDNDWSGQESAPCRPDDPTYSDVQQQIGNTQCDQANFGVTAGGSWCEWGGPNIIGTLGAVCIYEARISSLGFHSALGVTGTNDYVIVKPNAACSEGLPAYTFDRRITYNGTEYHVAGSCPAKPILGMRSSNPAWRCTLTTVSPTPSSTYEMASYSQYIGDIGVLWEVPALNPTARQHVMNFVVSTERASTACQRNSSTAVSPSIFTDIRVSSIFAHRELQN